MVMALRTSTALFLLSGFSLVVVFLFASVARAQFCDDCESHNPRYFPPSLLPPTDVPDVYIGDITEQDITDMDDLEDAIDEIEQQVFSALMVGQISVSEACATFNSLPGRSAYNTYCGPGAPQADYLSSIYCSACIAVCPVGYALNAAGTCQLLDSDGDGVADLDDAFPDDAGESVDTDGDGVGDGADAFPNDAGESVDTDGDGVGDNADAFPNDAGESADTDGDGVGDNADAFPDDPNRSEPDPDPDPDPGPADPPVQCVGGVVIAGACQCSPGFYNAAGVCLPIPPSPPPEVECTGGQVVVNGQCQCPAGQQIDNGVCADIPPDCPAGYEFSGGRCVAVPIFCPAGQEQNGTVCVPCPAGEYKVVGGVGTFCTLCPPGQTSSPGATECFPTLNPPDDVLTQPQIESINTSLSSIIALLNAPAENYALETTLLQVLAVLRAIQNGDLATHEGQDELKAELVKMIGVLNSIKNSTAQTQSSQAALANLLNQVRTAINTASGSAGTAATTAQTTRSEIAASLNSIILCFMAGPPCTLTGTGGTGSVFDLIVGILRHTTSDGDIENLGDISADIARGIGVLQILFGDTANGAVGILKSIKGVLDTIGGKDFATESTLKKIQTATELLGTGILISEEGAFDPASGFRLTLAYILQILSGVSSNDPAATTGLAGIVRRTSETSAILCAIFGDGLDGICAEPASPEAGFLPGTVKGVVGVLRTIQCFLWLAGPTGPGADTGPFSDSSGNIPLDYRRPAYCNEVMYSEDEDAEEPATNEGIEEIFVPEDEDRTVVEILGSQTEQQTGRLNCDCVEGDSWCDDSGMCPGSVRTAAIGDECPLHHTEYDPEFDDCWQYCDVGLIWNFYCKQILQDNGTFRHYYSVHPILATSSTQVNCGRAVSIDDMRAGLASQGLGECHWPIMGTSNAPPDAEAVDHEDVLEEANDALGDDPENPFAGDGDGEGTAISFPTDAQGWLTGSGNCPRLDNIQFQALPALSLARFTGPWCTFLGFLAPILMFMAGLVGVRIVLS